MVEVKAITSVFAVVENSQISRDSHAYSIHYGNIWHAYTSNRNSVSGKFNTMKALSQYIILASGNEKNEYKGGLMFTDNGKLT